MHNPNDGWSVCLVIPVWLTVYAIITALALILLALVL